MRGEDYGTWKWNWQKSNRAANIKSQDMMSMASTMSTVIKESEKEENKDTSLADILAALVGKNKLKQASKDTQEKDDDGR